MKQTISLAGCGEIATHYRAAIDTSQTLQLLSVLDIREDCAARSHFADLPFYTTLPNLLAAQKPNILLIATPPATHYALAMQAIRAGVSVLLEKPMELTQSAIDEIYAAAREHGVQAACMFHWKAAAEVLFLRDHLRDKPIKSLAVTIRDNYTLPGGRVIRPDKRPLMGAWLDSGINAISYIGELLPLRQAHLLEKEQVLDPESGLPVYAMRHYQIGNCQVKILIDWRSESSEKESQIEVGETVLQVSHTAQTVHCGSELLFSCPVADRLADHYQNFFRHFTFSPENERDTQLAHRILFE